MSNRSGMLYDWMRRSDLLLVIGVVVIIGMLIIPIPAVLLDVAIGLNLAGSLVILLMVLYVGRGSDLSIFPSLLLITTLFRLAINVSSTRLILLKGKEFDGEIIKAFGDFVVQNNYIVGFIIFLILIAVQFIVIIKGATRVAEVAARFTLDALPGKQMSIDADLNSGLITEKEALKRRNEVRKEVDFYGSMDGASKFVQGDVRVGLIITLINLLGGLIVGATMQGLSLGEAFDVFFILTVGDGLSAQIPSLLLSTATGIIVTRAVSEKSLGEDMLSQLNLQPKAMIVSGGFILALAILPGFPKIALILIGGGVMAYGIYINRYVDRKELGEEEEVEVGKESIPEDVVGLINVEAIEIEIGFGLVPLVDKDRGGDLLDRVKLIRRTCALDLGLLVPPIRIRDNMKLKPSDYMIKIRGVGVGRGSVRVKGLLAIPSIGVSVGLEGEETVEPAFGTRAIWIKEEKKDEAEGLGYSVVDSPSIVATHLTECIKKNTEDILGRQEVKQLLDNVREVNGTVVEEVLKVSNIGMVQKILHNLLREGVSIRNMVSILEVISDYGERVRNGDRMTEYVRQKLSKQISDQYTDEEGVMRVYTLDRGLEKELEDSIEEGEEGYVSTLGVGVMNELNGKIMEGLKEVSRLGYPMVILTSSQARGLLKKVTDRQIEGLVVISYHEVVKGVKLEQLGVIQIERETKHAI